MKSISTINPAITENTECTIIKAQCPSYWNKSGYFALTQWIIMLCFTSSSSNVWLPFQAKNNIRIPPACTALTLVSHRSHNVHTTNRHLCGKGERNGILRRKKISFGRTMMWALELLQLAKRHISGQSNVEQWRNQACSNNLLGVH